MRQERMHWALKIVAGIGVVSSTRGLLAQQPGPATPAKAQVKAVPEAAKAAPSTETPADKPKNKSSTDEEPVVTHHRISVNGKELKYAATSGLMPIIAGGERADRAAGSKGATR